ncbi:MAG: hypothetical protein AAF620_00295 [Bacteroidota bacterium]
MPVSKSKKEEQKDVPPSEKSAIKNESVQKETFTKEAERGCIYKKYDRVLKVHLSDKYFYIDKNERLFFESPMLKALKEIKKVKNPFYKS